MKKNNEYKVRPNDSILSIRGMVEVAVLAALIFLATAIFKIRIPPQMIHLGNAMVLTVVLLFGSKKGAVAASIALFLFDITHGWAAVAWITVLESLIVCLYVFLVYEKGMKKDDTVPKIIFISITAALLKVLINFVKYTFFYNMLANKMTFDAAVTATLAKIIGSYGTAVGTAVVAPILYFSLKPVMKKINRI